MKTNPAYIKGVHYHSFRSGEEAIILAVEIVTLVEHEPKACFKCIYPDGMVDYIPVSDVGNYELS